MNKEYNIPIPDQTFIESLRKDFTCPICKEILCNAVVTVCGIKICRYCLMNWLNEKKNCPFCNKGCQTHIGYRKIDTRIASVYQKVGPKLRDDRQALMNHRRLLEVKLELEQEAKADNEKEEEEEELRLSSYLPNHEVRLKKYGIEPGASNSKDAFDINGEMYSNYEKDDDQKNKRRTPRRFKPGNVQPNPFKKQLVGKNSTGSLRGDFLVRKAIMAQTGSKTILKSDISPSDIAIRNLYGNIKSPTPTPLSSSSLASINDANEKLSQELNNYYQRYIEAATKNDEIEKNIINFGQGDKCHKIQSQNSSLSLSKTVGMFNNNTNSSSIKLPSHNNKFRSKYNSNKLLFKRTCSNVELQKQRGKNTQEENLFDFINNVEDYIKKTSFDTMMISDSTNDKISNTTTTTTTTTKNSTNSLIPGLLKNILELQFFLQKRANKESNNNNNNNTMKNQETQTDLLMSQMLASAADLLKSKYSS